MKTAIVKTTALTIVPTQWKNGWNNTVTRLLGQLENIGEFVRQMKLSAKLKKAQFPLGGNHQYALGVLACIDAWENNENPPDFCN